MTNLTSETDTLFWIHPVVPFTSICMTQCTTGENVRQQQHHHLKQQQQQLSSPQHNQQQQLPPPK